MNWIRTTDKLPELDKAVLGYWKETKIEGVFISLSESDGLYYWTYLQDGDGAPIGPTYWAEIEHPKE